MSYERQRDDRVGFGPGHGGDDFESGSATAVAEGRVEVVHGVYAHSLPLVGMTIGQARAELAERMNIDPAAIAVVDGTPVAEDAVLTEGQVLTFVKHAGEKGRS